MAKKKMHITKRKKRRYVHFLERMRNEKADEKSLSKRYYKKQEIMVFCIEAI